jgi:hypothetical protein
MRAAARGIGGDFLVIPLQPMHIEFELRTPGLVERLFNRNSFCRFQLGDELLSPDDEDTLAIFILWTIKLDVLGPSIVESNGATASFV